jgi:RNA polymerase sigma-70 factor (ECF subfamily)
MTLLQPDLELLRRAQAGDHPAFCEIMESYEGPIFNYVLRMLSGDRALAEDMCQEVFLRVYQGLPGFNLRCRFTTWLFQVAKNRVLDELRARGRRATTPVDIDTLPQALLAREANVGFEDMDAVFRAIGSLSDDLKTALVLRDVVGLSYNEIAETLEISLATTKWRIYKAREYAAARLLEDGVLQRPVPLGVTAAAAPPLA